MTGVVSVRTLATDGCLDCCCLGDCGLEAPAPEAAAEAEADPAADRAGLAESALDLAAVGDPRGVTAGGVPAELAATAGNVHVSLISACTTMGIHEVDCLQCTIERGLWIVLRCSACHFCSVSEAVRHTGTQRVVMPD